MSSTLQRRNVIQVGGENIGTGSNGSLDQVSSNEDVSKTVPSSTQDAKVEHESSSFWRVFLGIFQQLFRALCLLSAASSTRKSDPKRGGVLATAKEANDKPLYDSLQPGQIRVYCMDSHQDELITGQLRTISINTESGFFKLLAISRPRYEALSYCWGNPKKTRTLICNGHEVQIHANLHDALVVLRKIRPGVPIWTDFLCIDQENQVEKLSQIRTMGKIYGAAQKVWAFLGDGAAGLDEAMVYLPKLCKHAAKIEKSQGARSLKQAAQGTLRPGSLPGNGVRRVHDLPPPNTPFWTVMFELVHSEYFNRLWVVQEVAFATRLEFLYGTYRISWTQMKALFGPGAKQIEGFIISLSYPTIFLNTSVFDMREIMLNTDSPLFWRIYLYLFEIGWPWVVAFVRRNVDGDEANMLPLLQIINNLDLLLKSQQLERMLDIAVLQECSKPQDRIFAILALFEAKTRIPDVPWNARQSVRELYVEAFYFLVRMDVRLELLSMAPDDPQSPLGLPSWCPTFRRRRQSGITERMSKVGGKFSQEPDWQASRRTQMIRRGSDLLKLRLDGIQISPVWVAPGHWAAINLKADTEIDTTMQNKAKANYDWLLLCLDAILADTDSSSPSYLQKLERFWRTMLLDNIGVLGGEDCKIDDWLEVMSLLERSLSSDSSFAQERAKLPRITVGPQQLYQGGPRVLRFLVMMDVYLTHKVFFAMGNGLFGITYQGVQTGDVLCLFQGAKMAHLLRRRDEGESWTFVGEAFVPGIMHGEAEEAVDGVLRETETFVLV